jgi:GTP cyclohydrolase I
MTSQNEMGIPRLVKRLKIVNADPYLAFASEMFDKKPSEVTAEERQEAKERIMASLYSSRREPRQLLEDAAKNIIAAVGRDITEEGLADTPRRVADAWLEDFLPTVTAEEALAEMIMEETFDQMLMVRNIPVRSHCEHHLLPWFGTVAMAYIPSEKTVGLSKLTRMVNAAEKGLSIQERVTDTLADTMQKVLKPLGCMVVMEAVHTCTLMRGVRTETQKFTTSATRGVFLTNSAPRQEFLTLLNRG